MELKKTWFEKLSEMSTEECLPLGDSPASSVYSAINFNREEFEEKGLKFRIQKDEHDKEYVCRVK